MSTSDDVTRYLLIGGILLGSLIVLMSLIHLTATTVPRIAWVWVAVFSILLLTGLSFAALGIVNYIHSIYLSRRDKQTTPPAPAHPSSHQKTALQIVGWSLISLAAVTAATTVYQYVRVHRRRTRQGSPTPNTHSGLPENATSSPRYHPKHPANS